MLIPRPLCGEAHANGGVTEHEIDDMLWAAVVPTVANHFAIIGLGPHKGKGRDKRPTSGSLAPPVAISQASSDECVRADESRLHCPRGLAAARVSVCVEPPVYHPTRTAWGAHSSDEPPLVVRQ